MQIMKNQDPKREYQSSNKKGEKKLRTWLGMGFRIAQTSLILDFWWLS